MVVRHGMGILAFYSHGESLVNAFELTERDVSLISLGPFDEVPGPLHSRAG